MTPATFGPPSHQPFGFYDPESSSVKTSQDTLLSDSTKSSVTLPKWGCLSGGALYELPTPAHLTSDNVCSGLLGTPNAHERTHTPRNVDHGIQLANQVSALLPTPAVNDMGAGKTPDQWDTWTAVMQERHANGNGRSLSIEAQRLLPTPRATDSHGTGEHGQGGRDLRTEISLLPTPTAQASKHGETPDLTANGSGYNLWDLPRLLPTATSRDAKGRNQRNDNTCLTGALTDRPSRDGNQSTGLHPGQLTIEDA